jgi:hypothetical protein
MEKISTHWFNRSSQAFRSFTKSVEFFIACSNSFILQAVRFTAKKSPPSNSKAIWLSSVALSFNGQASTALSTQIILFVMEVIFTISL